MREFGTEKEMYCRHKIGVSLKTKREMIYTNVKRTATLCRSSHELLGATHVSGERGMYQWTSLCYNPSTYILHWKHHRHYSWLVGIPD